MLNVSYGMLDRKRQAILKKMSKVGPFVMATATHLKVQCGNPDCKCVDDTKARHEKLHLSWGYGTAYVPVDLHGEVKEWIENYRTMKECMKEMTQISRQMIKMYAKTVGAHKRKMAKRAKA